MITTACPRCRRSLTYQDEHAGLQGQCDGCGSVFVIPEPTTPMNAPGSAPSASAQPNSALDSLASISGGQQQQGYQQSGYDGGYQQGGYQQSGYNPQYQTPYSHQQRYQVGQSYFGMAIAGFILAFVFSLLGLIFSAIALSGMKKSRNMEGHGFALAGLIISIVSIGLGCLWACVFMGMLSRLNHI